MTVHFSGGRRGAPAKLSIGLSSPTPHPSHLPWDRSKETRKFSLGFRSAKGDVNRQLWIRIRSEISSKQRKFANDYMVLHHLATSTSLGAGWSATLDPIRGRYCPSGHRGTSIEGRGQSWGFWSRGKVNWWQSKAGNGVETLNNCLMRGRIKLRRSSP